MDIVNIPIPTPQEFRFTLGDDKTVHAMPLMNYMPKRLVTRLGDIQAIADENEKGSKAQEWLENVFGEYCPELDLDDQPLSVFQAVMQAWQEASGDITLGESSASTGSAGNTRGHSTTISSPSPDTGSKTSRKRSTGSR
ncbi:hypothetical protein [Bifidobacterium simiiventris]|uniref:hypothetical protein n=1 Tax=Bifidobacterium simiiventris TaxID=2834434 RepID=UPI001C55C387|nr:hypothetical protein [Bifidobacterium simiiventris]MBW3077688.1 hypothetical protein [Bifidobacterium simiiventris]